MQAKQKMQNLAYDGQQNIPNLAYDAKQTSEIGRMQTQEN